MAMRWYVVHVYSGSEKRMAEAINDQIVRKGMQDYFAEAVSYRPLTLPRILLV